MVDRSSPPLTLRWPRAPQRRMAFLVVLLVLSLGLTAVLAYQAEDAAHSHRRTAERALRDYAGFAALEFSVNAKEMIWNDMTSILYGMPSFKSSDYHLAVKDYRARGEACPLSATDTTIYFFALDLHHPQLEINGCVSSSIREWITDTVPPHAHTYFKPNWDQTYIICKITGVPEVIVYTVQRDTNKVPVKAFGFVTALAPYFGAEFADVYHYPLLPPALVGSTPNDSMLSVQVTDSAGYVLYRSAVTYPPTYSGSVTTEKYGGFTTYIALRPSLADKLVIGGLPRSRLPLLLALLGLSVALVLAALLQLRREYELARLRADFISSISHELRTPLAQVRMFAETLLLGRVRSETERERSLQIIDQEARRLTHLVENVLLFSRAERRITRLAPEPTRLAEQVRETTEAFMPIANARRVGVETELDDSLVACVDRGAFRQTVLNLLDNAVKYGPPGQTVRVRLARADGRARLTVEDEGPGIAPRERARIWEPFYRMERDANSAVAGSGIGLAVVSELVALHGGIAHVDEAAGGGARFVIELPLDHTAVPPAPASGDGHPNGATAPAAHRNGQEVAR